MLIFVKMIDGMTMHKILSKYAYLQKFQINNTQVLKQRWFFLNSNRNMGFTVWFLTESTFFQCSLVQQSWCVKNQDTFSVIFNWNSYFTVCFNFQENIFGFEVNVRVLKCTIPWVLKVLTQSITILLWQHMYTSESNCLQSKVNFNLLNGLFTIQIQYTNWVEIVLLCTVRKSLIWLLLVFVVLYLLKTLTGLASQLEVFSKSLKTRGALVLDCRQGTGYWKINCIFVSKAILLGLKINKSHGNILL